MAWRDGRGRRRGARTARGRRVLPALACAAALLAAACRGPVEPAPALLVEHEISPHPPQVGRATLSLKLSDAAAKPLTGARVTLEGNMTHPGMIPVYAGATEVEPGRYRASLEFTMGGDWVVLVQAALPDGRKLERQLDIRGVRTD
jgi:hypothetical protein